MRWVVVAACLAFAGPVFAQDCVDAAAPPDDCDEDGFAPSENDCDDEDPAINPDAVELCGDGVDNNCDAEVDEACGLQDGELSGGSCSGAGGGWAVLGLPLSWLVRRRRT